VEGTIQQAKKSKKQMKRKKQVRGSKRRLLFFTEVSEMQFSCIRP